MQFVLNIIKVNLKIENFEHCKYVQDQIRWLKQHGFNLTEFSTLTNRFVNETYQTFLKLDWDRLGDKRISEFNGSSKYYKLKEEEIRTSFLFNNIDEINSFYDTFILLKKSVKEKMGLQHFS